MNKVAYSSSLKTHIKEEDKEEVAVKGSTTREAIYTHRSASYKLYKKGILYG